MKISLKIMLLASIGALVGAAAGSVIEKQSGTKPALEFTKELDSGRLMAE